MIGLGLGNTNFAARGFSDLKFCNLYSSIRSVVHLSYIQVHGTSIHVICGSAPFSLDLGFDLAVFKKCPSKTLSTGDTINKIYNA